MDKQLTLDDIWPDLGKGLIQLLSNLNQNFSYSLWMQLYTHVYNFCVAHGDHTGNFRDESQSSVRQLYLRLQDLLRSHVKELLDCIEPEMDNALLRSYKVQWDRFTTSMTYINHILRYLNIHWIKKMQSEVHSNKSENIIYFVYELGLFIWNNYLFMPLKARLTSALLMMIEQERNGKVIDTSLVQGVINTYVVLVKSGDITSDESTEHVFDLEFANQLLDATHNYYSIESLEFISSHTVSDYMFKVTSRLQEEEKRAHIYVNPTTGVDLVKAVEIELIDTHKQLFLDEFRSLLDGDKLPELTCMYNLLTRIPGAINPLREVFQAHAFSTGSYRIGLISTTALNNPTEYVSTLLDVYKKYNIVVTEAFQSDNAFISAIDRACAQFVNNNAITVQNGSIKSPELIAKYCDILLKKNSKNPEEHETLEILNNVMLLFKYIEEKDVFQTFYSKMLAKRLIHSTSSSEYLESQIISKLKQNCGYEYVSPLTRMFSDIELSKQLQDRFLLQVNINDFASSFSILVLGTSFWPLQSPTTNFSMPKELVPWEQAFTAFYQREYDGRKLTWLHQLSKGDVRARAFSGSPMGYTLCCSTYQMAVLLLFNSSTELTLDDLQIATQLNDNILRTTIMSLLKTKILKSSTGDSDVDIGIKSLVLSINEEFTSKRTRIMINVPVREPQSKDCSNTMESIEEGRRNLVQATIVRIMKGRKILSHTMLISELISQLQQRFKPPVSLIKKCIDILIEKEYLERAENQKDVYNYKP